MSNLLIRKCGTFLDISNPGGELPFEVLRGLSTRLSYIHKTYQHGKENVIDSYKCDMFLMQDGVLVTASGFRQKIENFLKEKEISYTFQDLTPEDKKFNFTPDWQNVNDNITFRERQEECLKQIVKNECGVIKAPTGFGKTFLILALALLYPKAKIHVVIKSKDVAARMVKQLSAKLPFVGQVGGGRKDFGMRITIFTADSLHYSDGDAHFLLCDEAHQLMAPTYSDMIGSIYRWSRNYAMTATPKGRFDGADAKLEMFFGKQIFSAEYDDAVKLGLVVPICVRWLNFDPPTNPVHNKKTTIAKKRWGVWRNQARNKFIAEDVDKYPADAHILILVETVEHAIYLGSLLPDFQLCYSNLDPKLCERYKAAGLLDSDYEVLKPKQREELRKDFETGNVKRVIATDVWATGVDFNTLQVVYNISGRQSKILNTQGPGRVSRISSGKEYGEVVDVIDRFDPAFLAKSKERRKHYATLNWEQDWNGKR